MYRRSENTGMPTTSSIRRPYKCLQPGKDVFFVFALSKRDAAILRADHRHPKPQEEPEMANGLEQAAWFFLSAHTVSEMVQELAASVSRRRRSFDVDALRP